MQEMSKLWNIFQTLTGIATKNDYNTWSHDVDVLAGAMMMIERNFILWLWLSWRALLDQLKFEPFDSLWSRAGSMNASVVHEKGVVKVFQVVKQPISDIFKQIVVEFDVIHLWSMLEEIAIDIYQSVVIQCSHYQIWERLEVITCDWIQSPKRPSKDKNVREEIL